MQIRIRYQLRSESAPREMELSPEDYFDPLEPGEVPDVRSVPRYLDAYRYTGIPADDLLWTVLEITDKNDSWRVRTQLLDGRRTLMHHTQRADGTEEIIHSTELAPLCWHVIRTLKQPGKSWAVTMSSLTVESPEEPTLKSRFFCERCTSEELGAFGDQ